MYNRKIMKKVIVLCWLPLMAWAGVVEQIDLDGRIGYVNEEGVLTDKEGHVLLEDEYGEVAVPSVVQSEEPDLPRQTITFKGSPFDNLRLDELPLSDKNTTRMNGIHQEDKNRTEMDELHQEDQEEKNTTDAVHAIEPSIEPLKEEKNSTTSQPLSQVSSKHPIAPQKGFMDSFSYLIVGLIVVFLLYKLRSSRRKKRYYRGGSRRES